jgi:hypothetical protein
MDKGLQAIFNAPIGTAILADLKARGVGMIRADLQGVLDEAVFDLILSEIQGAGLRPLAIITPGQAFWLRHASTLDVEVLNEPDLAGWTPRAYTTMFYEVCDAIGPQHRLWAGGASNCSRSRLAWLTNVVLDLPPGVGVSVHRYPKNGAKPCDPQVGFRTRGEEMAHLRRIVGDRPWGCSETGYHTGPQKAGWRPFTRRWRWTDGEIAAFAAQEWAWWREAGAAYAIWYQLNDGLSGDPLDRFGIRYATGEWKPVARMFQEAPC